MFGQLQQADGLGRARKGLLANERVQVEAPAAHLVQKVAVVVHLEAVGEHTEAARLLIRVDPRKV